MNPSQVEPDDGDEIDEVEDADTKDHLFIVKVLQGHATAAELVAYERRLIEEDEFRLKAGPLEMFWSLGIHDLKEITRESQEERAENRSA
jgi:hypothetical protein